MIVFIKWSFFIYVMIVICTLHLFATVNCFNLKIYIFLYDHISSRFSLQQLLPKHEGAGVTNGHGSIQCLFFFCLHSSSALFLL